MRAVLLATLLCGTFAQSAPRAVATPDRVVLGQDAQVHIEVTGLPEDADLRFAASSGELAAVPSDKRGDAHRFLWKPPDIRYPTWGVLLFWDARAEEAEVAVLKVPLWGRTALDMATEPRAKVRVHVGGRTFGPVTADGAGRVKVPIEVPPGVRTAQVLATADGRETDRTVPLSVPRSAPAALALGPEPMPPSGGWLLIASGEDVKTEPRSDGATLRRLDAVRGQRAFEVIPDGGAQKVAVTVPVRSGPHLTAQVPVGEAAARRWRGGSQRPSLQGTPLAVHVLGGGFWAGGGNRGLGLEVGAGYRLPVLEGRLWAELVAGWRQSGFEAASRLGAVDAQLNAFPLALAARYQIWERGPFAVAARAGAGVLPFRHRVRADFQPTASTGDWGFEAFAGAQGLYRVGPLDLVTEARGAFARAHGTQVRARPGGLHLSLGLRWSPP